MTSAPQAIRLTIRDEATGALLLGPASLEPPLRIGRDPVGTGGRVLDGSGGESAFGGALPRMSREHLTVEAVAGRLSVRDRSRNGTMLMGPGGAREPMAGTVAIEPGATRAFSTVGLAIEVEALRAPPREQAPPRIVYPSSSGINKSVDLTRGALALLGRGERTDMMRLTATEAGDAAREAAARADARCVVGAHGAGIAAVALPTGTVLCNRAPLEPGTPRPLAHLDTLNVDGMRLRVIAPAVERVLVCANRDCRQLNEDRPSHNCRFCGTRLGDAGVFAAPVDAWA